MRNTIALRIYDFLKEYPPFNFMAKEDLKEIATRAIVTYLEKDAAVFKRDEAYQPYFFIVQQGAVRLLRLKKEEERIVDMCDEGDLFGLKVTDAETYSISAITNEETILYGLPMDEFLVLAKTNKAISNYLIASFASNIKDPYSLELNAQLFTSYSQERPSEIYGMQGIDFSRSVIQCVTDTEIKEAAQLMRKYKVGCIVVAENSHPLGVVTSREFRDAIALGTLKGSDPVASIMKTPVICHTPDITVSQAQLLLLSHKISHLILTEDGTSHSALVGILSKHDIVVSFGNNPSELIKEIQRASKTKNIRKAWEKAMILLESYLDQNLPLSHILSIFNELRGAMTSRVVELSLSKMKETPPVSFAFLTFGSQGRNEQLLFTDQDNALIYANGNEEDPGVKTYFIKLGNRINKRLHKIGFDYCPADMMASNPYFCLSLNEWQQQCTRWMTKATPQNILLSNIFFDYKHAYGDPKLTEALSTHILDTLEHATIFFRYLAKDALKFPPPVGFFRQFLLESDGEYKETFDIKGRAMAPYIEAARVLILHHKVQHIHNTAARFEKLAQLEPAYKELFVNCAYAFKALLKFRVTQGLLHSNSGRFIDLQGLSKMERLKLKRCFKPLRDLQEVLKVRFQTQNLT